MPLNTPEQPIETSPAMREAFAKIGTIRWNMPVRFVKKGGYTDDVADIVCNGNTNRIQSIHFEGNHIIIEIV